MTKISHIAELILKIQDMSERTLFCDYIIYTCSTIDTVFFLKIELNLFGIIMLEIELHNILK